MAKTIPKISEKDISAWVGSRSFQLAYSYFEDGAIFDARRQGDTLKACCEGSMPQPYRLRATLGPEGISGVHCSCPVGGGGRCKHVGALLLTWLHRPEEFREVEELNATLERSSKAELIALIKQMLLREPHLETLLEVPLPGDGTRRTAVDPETYRRQASLAFRHGGDDWYAAWGIGAELEATVDIGDGFMAQDDFANASVVYQAVAQGVLEHYDTVHDEEGSLSEVVDRCVQGLGGCLAGVADDVVAREGILRALFEVYHFDVDYGGVGLGEGVPDLILEHTTLEEKRTVARWVRDAMPIGHSWSDNYHRQEYGDFLLDLKMEDLDDESFLSICRETGRLSDLVDRLLALGRLDEALAETEQAEDYDLLRLADLFLRHGATQRVEPVIVKRAKTTRDGRLLEWLKERYKERGELSGALDLARQLMQMHPHLSNYQEVRWLSQQLGVWHDFRPNLLADLAAAKNYALLSDIYLEEGEIDLALESVKQVKPNLFYGSDQMVRVAQAAEATRPRAAIDIYLQRVASLIEARGRDKYQQACKYLARVRELYRDLHEDQVWEDLIAQLRERYRRLPALKEELGNAGL